jgi:hypothetical protein
MLKRSELPSCQASYISIHKGFFKVNHPKVAGSIEKEKDGAKGIA